MSHSKSSIFRHTVHLALPCLLALAATSASAQTQYFPDGTKVNIASARGARATASSNLLKDLDPNALLHPAHQYELRFRSNYGAAWWMVELPETFKISQLRLSARNPITSIGVRVKVSTKPLDDAAWAAVIPVTELNGQMMDAAPGGGTKAITGTFAPVDARFVRLEIIGHNGAEKGAPGQNHPDLLLSRVQLFGPNKIPITPMFSAAQSLWAGGKVTSVVNGRTGTSPIFNDDGDPSAAGFGGETSITAPSSAPAGTGKKPTQVIVTLAQRSVVENVAYSAISPQRGERPRDVKIYTSPAEQGDVWTLQKSVKDASSSIYQEFTFDAPVLAKRVRFDIERVYSENTNTDGLTNAYLSELYVYGTAQPANFNVTVKSDAKVSAIIFDKLGNKIRTLWQVRDMKAGTYPTEWDGYTDAYQEAPKGAYELRLYASSGKYENIAAVGNTGSPPDADNHMVTAADSIWVDEEGTVYTANGWDEYAHDWKKWDKNGKALLNAHAQIRNGNPNGLPYRILADDKYIYAGFYAHGDKGSQWIQRFDRTTGNTVKWTGAASNGLIQIFPPSQEKSPLTDLATIGNTLFVGENRENRVLKYDKTTGAKIGEFPVPEIGALAADSQGRLWIGNTGGGIVVYDQEGKQLAAPVKGIGEIGGFSFGPGDQLFVADRKANQVLVYKVSGLSATKQNSLGTSAKPGDNQPDHFYSLWDVAAGPDGSITTIQRLPMHGTRMTKWTPGAQGWNVAWEQLGLEFTGNANYAADRPDEVISSYFHRYTVDKKTGQWKFNGNLYSGGYFKRKEWHGVPRWVKLGQNQFLFMALGDGMQVFKRSGNEMRFVAAIGGKNPQATGEDDYSVKALGQWTWSDANDDGQVQETEVKWFKPPGEGKYSVHGMNADPKGNVLFGEQHTTTIRMLPISLSPAGNPQFDWATEQVLVPKDTTEHKFFPQMVVRNGRGDLYAYGRSKVFPEYEGSGGAWMGGWTLAKFDTTGKRLWIIRLARHCTGMDLIPSRKGDDSDDGVICGYFRGEILHYTADGLLVGTVSPGAPAAGITGLLDNTGSIAVSRDPRDGALDVFAEEDLLHRILWYRIDDSKIAVTTQPIINK